MSEMPVKPKEKEARWPKLEPDKVMNESVKALSLAVVERAVIDWKELCTKIPKKKLCKQEIERRRVAFNEIRVFLKSDWCSKLLNNAIRRSKMIEELEQKYQDSAFLRQAQAFEAGETKC